ncbi:MAG: acetyl-CoA carboxylase biotin carboxyl carrier protein [Eubacteriales bacterium]
MDARKRLQEIITQFSDNALTELEFEIPDFKVRLVKENPIVQPVFPVYGKEPSIPFYGNVQTAAPISEAAKNESEIEKKQTRESTCEEVRSTLVGTFYASPSPSEDAFVSVGDKVKKGETMCIIEAMKIMNELCAPYDLLVKKVNCENGTMVQYNEVLFEVEKC